MQGVVVIDIVEGSALEALPFMMSVLDNKPKGFTTLNSAIEWSVASQTVRRLESARASIPSQLKENEEGEKKHVWKVDLRKSQQYW